MAPMLDWVSLALNASWITGLALLLAVFSYNRWLSKQQSAATPASRLSDSWIIAGYCLLGIGLVGTSDTLLQGALSFVLIVLLIVTQRLSSRAS